MATTLSHFIDFEALRGDGWEEWADDEPLPSPLGENQIFEQRNWERGDVLVTFGMSHDKSDDRFYLYSAVAFRRIAYMPIDDAMKYVRPGFREALLRSAPEDTGHGTSRSAVVRLRLA